VTLQDDLRQLDEELSSGRLSAEDYRRRRDELLAQQAPGGAEGGVPATPFPPPFRWETAVPDDTQVMQPIGDDAPSSDATQVVPGTGEPDSDRTQVVAGGPAPPAELRDPQVSRPQGPGQREPSWDFSGDASAPPWAGSDLPPIPDQQSTWMRQGPEVFEAEGGDSGRGKRVAGIIVLATLLVGLLVAGVLYAVSGGSAPQAGDAAPAENEQQEPIEPPPPPLPAPPEPSPPPVDTPQALIDPPGDPRAGGGLLDLPGLESGDLLPRPIIDALQSGGMTDGILKTSTQGDTTIGMFAFALRDEQAAIDVAEWIAYVQLMGGLKDDRERALQGVEVLRTAQGADSTVRRAVYVLYDRVVYFETFGPDQQAALDTFDALLDEQVAYAPPTVR